MKRVVKFVQRWNFTSYLEFDIDLEKNYVKEMKRVVQWIVPYFSLNFE